MADYQGSYNGLSFGPGTSYGVRSIRWWRRATNINTPPLPRYHGGIVGASYETPRQVEVEFVVVADTAAELVDLIDDLYAAFQPHVDTESPLVWEAPGVGERLVYCRPIDDSGGRWDKTVTAATMMVVGFRLLASDPAIYGDEQSTVLTPYTSADGFTWPAVWPIVWGAGGAGGGFTATNSGEWETWPTITITGPTAGTLSDPIVQNVTAGTELALIENGGVEITSGQTLIIETHPAVRTIEFSTGASRRGRLSAGSEWWPLQPGDSEIRFRASGTTTGATCTITYRSAWI